MLRTKSLEPTGKNHQKTCSKTGRGWQKPPKNQRNLRQCGFLTKIAGLPVGFLVVFVCKKSPKVHFRACTLLKSGAGEGDGLCNTNFAPLFQNTPGPRGFFLEGKDTPCSQVDEDGTAPGCGECV